MGQKGLGTLGVLLSPPSMASQGILEWFKCILCLSMVSWAVKLAAAPVSIRDGITKVDPKQTVYVT